MLLQLHICHTLLFFVTNFIMCIVSNYLKKILCLCLWGFLNEKLGSLINFNYLWQPGEDHI